MVVDGIDIEKFQMCKLLRYVSLIDNNCKLKNILLLQNMNLKRMIVVGNKN